ncbi:Holliday junction resolvase RuvX [Taibaiella koreensis]|uniref:Holliday junction resolvase RuvX n=1 Tax=Taibaiella koreensis TaxID=1268548 RepID=UPI000E59ED56|nr:Holliday junction resolvase RuvX [Taibaiella koreensis]
MARILAIDYGKKRTGLAVTDPLKIIASGLATVDTEQLIWQLKQYFAKETVELILLGHPRKLDGSDNEITPKVEKLFGQLQKLFPDIPVKLIDERFTSKMAFQSMIDSGLKKQDRQNKALIDEISATILLQGYLDGQQS